MTEVERMARREPPAQFTQPEHKLYVHRPPSALLVMVCRARDLIMCDYNWLTRTGSSDPTVKLQVEGRDEVEQSSTQYKTLTPEWDEDFLLPCDDPEETLRVTVEDYDRFSGNDFMGCDLGVLRCCGAFTPSTRVVSRRGGRGWSFFGF